MVAQLLPMEVLVIIVLAEVVLLVEVQVVLEEMMEERLTDHMAPKV